MSYEVLLGQLDEWFAKGTTAAGPGVVLCKPGCSECCNGPFDISPADAHLVARAVQSLAPAIRATITQRAKNHLELYAKHAPDWPAPWDVAGTDENAFDALGDALAALPCPALSESGLCLIYESRPATCRMTGLSMITEETDILENSCPIIDTSQEYAALQPSLFALTGFEDAAEDADAIAMTHGWQRTTVAAAIMR